MISQTVGTGETAVGRVIAYDQTTGVLKYWQDRTIAGFATATGSVSTAQTPNCTQFMVITQQDLLLIQMLVVM